MFEPTNAVALIRLDNNTISREPVFVKDRQHFVCIHGEMKEVSLMNGFVRFESISPKNRQSNFTPERLAPLVVDRDLSVDEPDSDHPIKFRSVYTPPSRALVSQEPVQVLEDDPYKAFSSNEKEIITLTRFVSDGLSFGVTSQGEQVALYFTDITTEGIETLGAGSQLFGLVVDPVIPTHKLRKVVQAEVIVPDQKEGL